MVGIKTFVLLACLILIQEFSALAQETSNAVSSSDPQFISDISLPAKRSYGKIVVTESEPEPHLINRYDIPEIAKVEAEETVEEKKEEASTKTYTLQGIGPAVTQNVALYNFIDEWYGVRYRLGGHDKSGIDCSAFVQKLYDQVFGTPLLRSSVEQFKSCDKINGHQDMKEGDLVFFQHTYGRRRHKRTRISHVGIYLANNFFVHASSSQGVTISSLEEPYWKRLFAGAGKASCY
jgi:lipoprotein Spr